MGYGGTNVTTYPSDEILAGGAVTGAAIPVRVATDSALTLATDFENGDTIDGVVIATDDRVLNKNAVAGEENGPWIVQASGAPVRPTDFDADSEVVPGMLFSVAEGTANADTVWQLTTDAPITLGVTALVFGKGNTLPTEAEKDALAGTGVPSAANPYVNQDRDLIAGAGQTGGGDLSADRTFDVVANADASIVVNANDIQVGVLATDAQHGVRGGSTQHADVIAAGADGFMTGADKFKLDGFPANVVSKVFADSPYTTAVGEVVQYDVSGGGSQVDLPTATGVGGQRIIIKKSAGGAVLTVDAFGAQTIDNVLTAQLVGAMKPSLTLISDGGTNWISV